MPRSSSIASRASDLRTTLAPLWECVVRGVFEAISSELTLLETLVGPMKTGDSALETDYEDFLRSAGIRLLPISPAILRAAGHLRATSPRFRTPDAIHAATASACGCTLLRTNDAAFRPIPGVPVVILDDLLKS